VTRAIIIGAARSGSGKTSVTIGLQRALARRGFRVSGAKSGPDYIDPGFHAAATGRPGVNLDSWGMPPGLLAGLLAVQARDADIVIIESAMGLFDGIPAGEGRTGSAADLARRLSVPVLLVLDVSGQSQTAAPIAKGFATFDPGVTIAGVVLNRCGSERHVRLALDAVEAVGLPVVGAVMRSEKVVLPERHLGLVQAEEHEALDEYIDALADIMEASLDLDAVMRIAGDLDLPQQPAASALPPPGQRIAIARDAAFTFLYPHLARLWREAGAELLPFSPLAGEAPDESCDVCWLPGGYPELHAGRLAAAEGFRAGMARFAASRPVHGECGGYMVLGEALTDADGSVHRMLGLLSHATSFAKRRMNLGYRQARLLTDGPLGAAGTALRGHEFHYASVTDPGSDAPFAELADGLGNPLGASGGRRGQVSGTFFHAIAAG
jgi:cobyrinic acid a,c-diamide synthase